VQISNHQELKHVNLYVIDILKAPFSHVLHYIEICLEYDAKHVTKEDRVEVQCRPLRSPFTIMFTCFPLKAIFLAHVSGKGIDKREKQLPVIIF
jgi:hypothetical protein